jgi:hypothetical protein
MLHAAIHFLLIAVGSMFVAGIPLAVLICWDRPRDEKSQHAESAVHVVRP